MQEVLDFLKKVGVYYLATVEDGQPRVRPFGTIHLYDGKLYFLTGRSKSVSRQLHANPRLELCAFSDGVWLRVEASAAVDDRREAKLSILEAYPELKNSYSPDDGNMEIWYLRNAAATFSSFTEPPKTLRF